MTTTVVMMYIYIYVCLYVDNFSYFELFFASNIWKMWRILARVELPTSRLGSHIRGCRFVTDLKNRSTALAIKKAY